jgi:S1-C subfamily serine protease
MAVGSSVSVGVIAAVGRSVDVDGVSLLDMIQTDLPLPGGFDGSPLVDGTGAVVGICTQVNANSYATPIDVARSIADQLIEHGSVVHAWLGIEGEDLGIAASDELKLIGAAVITKVRPGGPAANAGMVPGDVITAIDGSPLPSMAALKVALRSRAPGQIVGLALLRDGRATQIRATLAPRPAA